MQYDLNHLHTLLADLPKGQLFVLTDSHTAEYCLPILADFIGQIPYHLLTIEAGEQSKNLASVQAVWDFMLKHRATRQAVLINIGGGVVTDLGGFAAATYMRGIRFLNIPTTLLAMVDASTGGKTGINFRGVKNSIGTFSQPMATLIYPPFLSTLSSKEILSGMAEMIKHGLIISPSHYYAVLTILEDYASSSDSLFSQGGEAFRQLISDSIAIKENLITQDPTEKGMRKILNFGHTIGHAIEEAAHQHAFSGKEESTIPPHGYCVMWGMVAALYLSVVKLGFPKDLLTQVSHVMLMYYGRPNCDCKERQQLIKWMLHDKKNMVSSDSSVSTIRFTLLRDIGEAAINQTISNSEIDEALEYLFSL